jgi:T-complex protein 1 subunit alpha
MCLGLRRHLAPNFIILNIAYSSFQSSREQLAIAEFARALLVIPKQLAVNAAKDSTDLVAKLRAYHNTSQIKPEHEELKW